MSRGRLCTTLFPYTTLFRSVEALEVAVNRHPQVEHDPLPGELHRPGLDVFGRERDDEDRQVQRGEAVQAGHAPCGDEAIDGDRKSTRLNSSHQIISYAVFCLNESWSTVHDTLSLHDALPICRGAGGGGKSPSAGRT